MYLNTRRYVHGLAMVVVLAGATCCGPIALAEIPQNSKAAEDAQYACDVAGPADAVLARARALGAATHDRNSLGCAADLLFAQARASVAEATLLREAIVAHIAYLDQVQIEKDLDFIGVQTAEWTVRLNKAGGQMNELAQQALKSFPQDAALTALRAQADLLVHRYDDPVDYVKATKRAIPMLSAVATAAPAVLDGAPLVYLGKLYLDLPTIFGGSGTRAIELLERAREVDAKDSRRLSYLADAYEQDGRREDSKQVLDALLAVEPREGTRQFVADAWMTGIGLADRLGDAALRTSFEHRRHALLAAHPELMTRARTAVAGHGGEDPLTGKRQY